MGGSDSKVDPSNGDDGKNADGDDKKQVGPDGGTYVTKNTSLLHLCLAVDFYQHSTLCVVSRL